MAYKVCDDGTEGRKSEVKGKEETEIREWKGMKEE